MDETVARVDQFIRKHKPLHLMGVNADKINTMQHDKKLAEIVNSCEIINADGASVVLASRFLSYPLPERVAGIDLMQRLLSLAAEKGYSVYFLGAKQKVVEAAVEKLQRQYVGLKVCGFRNGYFSDNEWGNIAAEIKEKNPSIVFVGISSPKKEYLIQYFQEQGLDSVFMGVGGSFDVLSGFIPRAPEWMQEKNLEWLFRLMQEPRRLWKRYLVGNSKFMVRVVRQKVHNTLVNQA
jgi:N-acetylglucosaminyldiphosphoundecaprenol N-acetyl-beta-D-mannosaminyltransferase